MPREFGSAAVWHQNWPLAHLPALTSSQLGTRKWVLAGHQSNSSPKEPNEEAQSFLSGISPSKFLDPRSMEGFASQA